MSIEAKCPRVFGMKENFRGHGEVKPVERLNVLTYLCSAAPVTQIPDAIDILHLRGDPVGPEILPSLFSSHDKALLLC